MAAIMGALVGVWLLFFAAWGNLHDIVPPGRMTQDSYALQYMIIGAIVCVAGAVAASMWFSSARNYGGRGSLGTKYRSLMALPLVVGGAGMGYLMFLGAGDAGVNYVLTLLAGLLVYIIAACLGTPAAGRKYPPFG
ncbi:MAG: hypothetical protein SOV56_01485 [Phascolarctobacterium sp.]|nr:hypothetical protein [Phascolarctobacterium sp.]